MAGFRRSNLMMNSTARPLAGPTGSNVSALREQGYRPSIQRASARSEPPERTPMPEPIVTILRPKAVLDVDRGELLEGATVRVEGNRIAEVSSGAATDGDRAIDLPDLTLVPGLMDMEVDLVLGGPGAGLND